MNNLLSLNKNGPCGICGMPHKATNPCNQQAMAVKITRLMQANALIPGLMEANKEAVNCAQVYQFESKKWEKQFEMLVEVVMAHATNRDDIMKEFMGRLDVWLKDLKPIKQDTSEQQSLFNPEPLTSPETETSDSTKQPSGLVSENGSSL